MDDPGRRGYDAFDIPVVRIEQGASRDEPAHIGLAHGLLPAGDHLARLFTRVAAEKQDRHGGGRGHLCDPLSRGDLEPGVGTARSEARGDGHHADEFLVPGVEVGAPRIVLEIRQRFHHAGETLVRQLRDDLAAHLNRARYSRVREFDPQEQFASIEASGGDVLGVVRRNSIVQLPRRTLDAASVDGADGYAPVEGAKPREFLEDVGARHDPVDTGHGEAAEEVVEEGVAVGDRERVAADGDHPACGVISRENEQIAVIPGEGTPSAVAQCALQRSRLEDPRLAQGPVVIAIQHQESSLAIMSSTCSIVGIASAQVSFVAT